MPKMRVLIATRGDRRSAIASALGIHHARPQVEIGAADDRDGLFRALAAGPWHALVLDHALDGVDAREVLGAASELVHNVAVFILAEPGATEPPADALSIDDLAGLAERILSIPGAPVPSAPIPAARTDPETGLPSCDTLDELLKHDGRRPRTGLLSCVAIDAAPTPETARIVMQSLGEGGAACRWQALDILVLRRAASPGEALVWAEGVRSRLAHASMGVTWFRANELQDSCINQADHALRLALSRADGEVCSWQAVVALRLAERIGAAEPSPISRRDGLLRELAHTLGPVQREQLTTHSEEVGLAARSLGQLLHFPPEECDRIHLAGLLHDLGKLAIPDDLLAKPGPLSPVQRRVLDRHSEEGAHLCHALRIDPEVARIVRHHHTRFDALEPAPDAARIVAVADAMVTMTSARPYSPARSFSYALAELRRCRGTIFDPRAVVAAHILGASSMRAVA